MVLVNGAESDVISVCDRGLLYGDGVFRTFRAESGVVQSWQRQYQKLKEDCARLALDLPERSEIETDLFRVLEISPDSVVKIVITRGAGPRGYALNPESTPTRIVMTSSLPQYPPEWLERGVKVRVCDVKLSVQPRLAGIKHLNRLENVLARAEWQRAEYAEGLMLDGDGNVIEGTMSNIFAWLNDALITPDLTRCGVAGVQRDRVLEYARSQGIPVRIEAMKLDKLLAAEEVFLTNSVIGVWQVRELEVRRWNSSVFTSSVRSVLQSDET
ncbi:MAG: aminodeoxychorismate lyase [Burkholderiales bacterium]